VNSNMPPVANTSEAMAVCCFTNTCISIIIICQVAALVSDGERLTEVGDRWQKPRSSPGVDGEKLVEAADGWRGPGHNRGWTARGPPRSGID